ncbi:MFS transporter, partial [Rhodoferax sp.]|uniref:MFS transporter n=1 Tax=Rhodoferax sp. TaxID=50421 RepID=UPI0019E38C3E
QGPCAVSGRVRMARDDEVAVQGPCAVSGRIRGAGHDESAQGKPGRQRTPLISLWHPLQQSAFRRLLAVFMVNGIASAIPATLVLFFVQDRLQGSEALQSAALGLYFVCAAASMPLWLRAVARLGLARSWALGMGLSVLVFLWASQLGAGDGALFLIVCALSGAALGSDLALPGAMLAGLIDDAGDRGRADGAYFGWWNFATKLNLALAAGLALPLLGWLGYVPGARDAQALQVLTVAYCLLPCALKTGAAALLYFSFIQPAARPLTP